MSIFIVSRRDMIVVDGANRPKGGIKGTWMEAVKRDMVVVNLSEEMALNKLNGRKGFKIHVADP